MHAQILSSNALLAHLHHRQSARDKNLQAPAPDDAQLAAILQSAMSAPDHGRLTPWRYLYIRNDARAQLGAVFADAAQQQANQKGLFLSAAKLQQLRDKPLRAPLIVVAIASFKNTQAVPQEEQLISAALGAEHIQLAAEALGFASIWLSGAIMAMPAVRSALKIQEHEQIIGFLYIGTRVKAGSPSARPDFQQFCQEWHGAHE